ncbi:hypothetical protein XA68_10877 [Ophiocordyceps unilateralis]|uniref:Uncharacterized protein n=1 Tax=Ophiocordyceps unilateralis TaxID=268505 RepID=A0A2A9PHX7_OPHUN|nr:hypothetical protein XA68_10877 [Ophiocordyceps unilateralis]
MPSDDEPESGGQRRRVRHDSQSRDDDAFRARRRRRRRSGFDEEPRRRRPVAVLWNQTGRRLALYEDHGRIRVRAGREQDGGRDADLRTGGRGENRPSWSPPRRTTRTTGLFVKDGEAPAVGDEDAAGSGSDVDAFEDAESLGSFRDVEAYNSHEDAGSYGSLDDDISRHRRPPSPGGEDVDVLDGFDFVFPGAKPSYQLSDLLDMAGQESDSSPKDDHVTSLRPIDATCVFSSSYTGDAELGGSHGAELTVLHDGQGGRTRPLFSWLHVRQQVMNFDDFWAEISHRVRFSEGEKKATAKLRADVKRHAIKSRQNERGDTIGLMEPRYYQVPLGGAAQEKQAARWICLPYFSLQPCSGLLSASSPASFPPQTLLQSHYSRTPRQRDMRQAVCQLGVAPKGSCFHIAQLWCLVLDNSLLVTCASMSQSDLCSASLKLVSQPPQREPGSSGSGRILVSYGSAVLWVFRVRDCPTWFSFVARFNAFWPKRLEFRWRDRVIDPSSWPKMLKLASLPRASVLLRLNITSPQAEANKPEQLEDLLHVLTLGPKDSVTLSDFSSSKVDELRTQLVAAEKFLLSHASFPQRRAYKSCVGASRREVLEVLASESSAVEAEADDSMRSSHEERFDFYNSSETVFQLFLPRDFDGPTTDKYWGSVRSITMSSSGDDRLSRPLRESLRTISQHIRTFQSIMAYADQRTRATISLPQQLVTAWLHVVLAIVSAGDARAGWRAHMDKAKALIEQGIRTVVQAVSSRSLVDDSAVLPMEIVSLIAAELLRDRVGKENDVVDTYSQFLSSLNTDITTKPSDRSYQHRIELVRQEMSLIERTVASQRLIIDDIRSSLSYRTSGDDDVLWRRRDVVVTRTVRREATMAWPMASGRARMATEPMALAQLRPDELAAASKLSSTDELGFRDLLLAECGRAVEARELELQRLGEYAEELEQDVVFKMGSTKDKQEQAIYAFTVVTIIFLPISAISSIFGMNTNDIRNMASDQWLYWAVAVPVTVVVILAGLWWMNEFGGGAAADGQPVVAGRERVIRSPGPRVRPRTRTRTRSTF